MTAFEIFHVIQSFLWVALAITVSMVPCWLVVMPKVRRVMGGEVVVVSNLLRQVNFGISTPTNSNNAVVSSLSTSAPVDQSQSIETKRQDVTKMENASSISVAATPEQSSSAIAVSSEATTSHDVINLKIDDPIPKGVEKLLYGLNQMIQTVNFKRYVMICCIIDSEDAESDRMNALIFSCRILIFPEVGLMHVPVCY